MFKATIDKMKKRKRLVIGAIILLLIVVFFVNKNNAQSKNTEIKSFTVKRADLNEELILSGELKASEYAKLAFKTGGKLVYVGVKEGDYVTKGKTIASLDQRDLQKQLKKDLNDYKTARWNFDQQVDEVDNAPITTPLQRLVDKSQFTLDNSVLDVEIQSIALEYGYLSTPISGIVVNTSNLHPGMNVTVADVFEVVNPDTMYFELVADQTELTQLREGVNGKLVLDAYIDEEIPGNISKIAFSPKENESGTVYSVQFAFNSMNTDRKYRLGMTGDVTFVTDTSKNALYIPFSYVHEENNKKYVYTSADKKQKMTIKTGLETESNVEIVSGLKEGDVIYD